MNNYEKIKSMTIDEIIYVIMNIPCRFCIDAYSNCYDENCTAGVKKWLEQEVETI